MKTITAADRIEVTDGEDSPEGFLIKTGNIARTGVQEYLASELGLDGLDPMKVVRLYRPADEVFRPESMASFDGKPVTVDHPPVLVTRDNWKTYAVGDVCNVRRSGDFMAAKIVLKDSAAINALKAGKHELSNGYTFTLDMTPGVAPDGQGYDGVQRNIRGNHLALVEAARCGSACRVLDHNPSIQGNNPMTTRKVVVDGIPVEVSDTAAGAIEKLLKDRDDALKLAVDADTKHKADQSAAAAAHAAALAAKDAEIATLKKDVITPEARDAMVADWAKLIADAKRLVPTLATDGKTCAQIRREVIGELVKANDTAKAVAGAVLAGKELATADADALRAAFNAVSAAIPAGASEQQSGNDSALGAALLGKTEPTQAMDAHDLFVANMTQGA